MDKIVGTCSICKGAVTLPDVWHGTKPPIPTCRNCGATPASPYGPTIKMAPNPTKPKDRTPITNDDSYRPSTTVPERWPNDSERDGDGFA